MTGNRIVRRTLAGLSTAAALMLGVGCQSEVRVVESPAAVQRVETQPVAVKRRFAGSARCVPCHQEISKQYSTHPMANSAGLADASMPVVESFASEDAEFQKAGYRYRIERSDDGTMTHTESRLVDGAATYSQSFPIDYFVGSAEHGRSYLLKKGDMLFESPITWYAEKKRWDLSPGYEQHNQHFDRRISGACVTCHFGRPNPATVDANRFQEPMFTEHAIGCENCHGAAADHVDWHNGLQTVSDLQTDPILAIADLEPDRQASICNQCHLVGTDRVLRQGKTALDFTPGELLEETWVCFIKADADRDSSQDAVSHVEQMRMSVCFQEAAPQMQCTSCHDPHFSRTGVDAIKFYRQRCIKCHNDESVQCSMPEAERLAVTEHDSCMKCHMPKQLTADVAHTTMTDHRVLRDGRVSMQNSATESSESIKLFNGTAESLPRDAIQRALLTIAAQQALTERDAFSALRLLPKIEKYLNDQPEDAEMYLHAGSLYHLTRDARMAQHHLEHLLVLQPLHEQAVRKLFIIAHESNSLLAGIHYGRAYQKLNPWDADATGRLIHLLGQTDEFEDAVQLARRALKRFPRDQQIKTWLANAEEYLRKRRNQSD